MAREFKSQLQNHTMSREAGVSIRVSTEDRPKGESPTHHEARARSYAELKGWRVVENYDPSGVSGKSVLGHFEAKKMRADIASGRIKALIFTKLARFARNTQGAPGHLGPLSRARR